MVSKNETFLSFMNVGLGWKCLLIDMIAHNGGRGHHLSVWGGKGSLKRPGRFADRPEIDEGQKTGEEEENREKEGERDWEVREKTHRFSEPGREKWRDIEK